MSSKEVMPATVFEEIKPLISLCKAGQLFEVQEWIDAGKPVDPPLHKSGNRKKSPLEYSIDLGFHSMVKVLLQGGANVRGSGGYCPMLLALEKRRFDIVQLLIQFEFDPKTVDMLAVFHTWDPEIMEYFIEAGADLETELPLARALCDRIQTSLRIVKKYAATKPTIQPQVDFALRYHCKEGNLKWVSLLLWAGADPLSKGDADPYAKVLENPEEYGVTALAYAALYDHYELFELKKVKLDTEHPAMHQLLSYCNGSSGGVALFRKILELGVDPNDQDNGGCSIIHGIISSLEWKVRHRIYSWELNHKDEGHDSEETREYLKMVYLLAKHGAKWKPDKRELNAARKSLLKMTPDYTVEFVWILYKFNAAELEVAINLTRTPTIKRHIRRLQPKLTELFNKWRTKVECEESSPIDHS